MRAAAIVCTLAVLALAPTAAAERWVAPPSLAAAPRAAERWVAPVPGGVTRGFAVGANPFAGGQHRGADFAAVPGATVRAACGGLVVVAGRVGTSGRLVTIRCGRWRVTHQPLAEVGVAAGALVAPGAMIGTVAPSRAHAGLHLGVRREGRRFAYVDPLRFLGAERPPPPAVRAPRGTPPRPAAVRPAPAREAAAPAAAAAAAPAAPAYAAGAPFAPWPAWLGLTLLLAGAVGAGVRRRPWRRRAPLPRAVAQEVP